MEFSLIRVKALVKKEMKDFPKNINVSLICLIPLVLVLILTHMQGNDLSQRGRINILTMGLNMNLVMVSTLAISMLIAEEKEKNTMRTLMLSSVRPAEFFAGKVVVILLFSIVTNIAIYFIAGLDVQHLGHYVLWSVIVTCIMMQIGGIIGLIAQNQMSTSALGAPVVFGFMLLPAMSEANEILDKIASILPNHNLSIILEKIIHGEGYAGAYQNILIIFAWVILTSIAFMYTYNRNSLDK